MRSVDPCRTHCIAIAVAVLLVTTLTTLPALAGTCGVLPFTAEGGVDQRAADNIASLISSELDIVGDFEFVLSADAKEITAGCGKDAACRKAFGEGEDHSHVVAGSVSPAGADEYTINAALYEVASGREVRQISSTVGRKPDLLLDAIPGLAAELATGRKKARVEEQEDDAVVFDEPAFDDEEDAAPRTEAKRDWEERDRHGRRVRAEEEPEENDLFGDIDEELNLDELDEDRQRKKQAERREREAKEAALKAEEARLARIAQEEIRRREAEERRAEEDARRREREEERAREEAREREEKRRLAEERQAEEEARQVQEERRRRDEERQAARERREREEREAREQEERRDEERRLAEERRREREEREAEEAREREERRAAESRRERETEEGRERDRRRAADSRREREVEEAREREAARERDAEREREERRLADSRRDDEPILLIEEVDEPRLSSALESDEDDGFVIEDEDPGFVIEDDESDDGYEVEDDEPTEEEGAVLIAHEDDEVNDRSRRRRRRRDYDDAYSRAREFSDRDSSTAADEEEPARSYDRDDRSGEEGDFDELDREDDDRDADDRLAYNEDGYPERGSRERSYADLEKDEAVRVRPSRERAGDDYGDVSSRYDDRDEYRAQGTARAKQPPSDRQYINIRGHFGYTNYYLHFAEYGLDVGVLVHPMVSVDVGIDFLSVGLTETDVETQQDVQRIHTLPTFTVGGSWHGQFHKVVKPWAGAEFSSTLYAVVRRGGPDGPREPRGSAGFNVKGGVDFMFLRFLGVHVGVKGGLAYSPDIETTVSADWRPLAGVFNATVGATLQF